MQPAFEAGRMKPHRYLMKQCIVCISDYRYYGERKTA